MKPFQTIVLGLGAMGSATVHHLARRGHRVLGIDRFAPPHANGSSHGETRITRLAIGEGDQYTPLVIRSHQLWRKLPHPAGKPLMTMTGGLIISSAAKTSRSHVDNFFQNTLAAAQKYSIVHEVLDAEAIRRRFPNFRVADDERGYFEQDSGFLRPEECVRAHLMMAERNGAELHRDEQVLGFEASPRGVSVVTSRDKYVADKLVLAAGAWLPELLGARFARLFRVYRQTLFWFEIEGDGIAFLPDNWPVFIWELQGKKQGIYGFPAVDGPRGGLKVATECYDATTTAETVSQEVSDDEKNAMYDEYVAPYVAGVSRRCLRAASCLYTVTPDFGFIIDNHPDSERVIIVSPCSGHGFKHSPAIGEAISEIIMDGRSRIDLSPFALKRFPT